MKIKLKLLATQILSCILTRMTEVFEFLLRALKSKFIGTIEINYLPTGEVKVSFSRKSIKKNELAQIPI